MKKIFLLVLFAVCSWQAEAQINNLTIEEVVNQPEEIGNFIEQDINLIKEHIPDIPAYHLDEAKNILKMKYEKLVQHHADIPQEKVESFCHSLTERFKAIFGDQFQNIAEDPKVIRQLSGLSLFVRRN